MPWKNLVGMFGSYYSRGRYSARCFCEAKTEFNGTKMRPDAFVCIAKRVTVRGPVAVNSNTFGILCIFTWRLFLTY